MPIRILILCSSLVIGALTSALAIADQPIALHFTLPQPYAQNNSKYVTAFLKNNFPGHKVVEIEIDPGVLLVNEVAAREKLFNDVSKNLAVGDVITHLVIDGPAKRVRSTSETIPLLSDVDQATALVREHISPNLSVILNGGKALIGDDASASAKVHQFLGALGASNGTLYASYNGERPTIDSEGYGERAYALPRGGAWVSVKNATKRTGYSLSGFPPTLAQLKVLTPIAIALGLGSMFLAHGSAGSPLANLVIGTFGTEWAGLGFILAYNAFVYEIAEMSGFINHGRLFSFANGEVTGVKKLQKAKYTKLIYNVPGCRQRLEDI